MYVTFVYISNLARYYRLHTKCRKEIFERVSTTIHHVFCPI
jgi:hypothetical protein